MPKYLCQSSYTQEGLKGLMKEGGTAREAAIRKGIEAMGGKLEAIYYALGQTDVFIIMDLPDNVNAAAASMVGNAPGTSKNTYTVLLTPKQVDKAAKIANETAAGYRPPGR